jgi:hypothetical protein
MTVFSRDGRAGLVLSLAFWIALTKLDRPAEGLGRECGLGLLALRQAIPPLQ